MNVKKQAVTKMEFPHNSKNVLEVITRLSISAYHNYQRHEKQGNTESAMVWKAKWEAFDKASQVGYYSEIFNQEVKKLGCFLTVK